MEYDVVVLGTGAAGLAAALSAHDHGAQVGLFEKGAVVGGTTAISGGVAWIPINKYAARAGINDTRDEALAYLASLSHGMIVPELAVALVDTGPELIDWLEANTPLRLQLVKGYPDYHPERPGGKPRGGRSLEPELFSYSELGEWADKVAGTGAPMTIGETPLGGGTGFLDDATLADRTKRKLQGTGRAMAGALLKACLDRGIVPQTESRACELVRKNGRVTQVKFRTPRGEMSVGARRGVIIATGGFEWDKNLVRSFLRGPMHFPASIPTNTGDGLRMAMKLGAMLGNMREAWWIPVALKPGEKNCGEQAVSLVLRERTLPRSILVNRKGQRFTNEATNYNALGAAFHQFDAGAFEYSNLPCWLIVDHEFVRLYGGFGVPPGRFPDWAVRANTLRELGTALGIPGDVLEQSVTRWNRHVAEGHDPDFSRGESAYDGWSGDQRYYPERTATLGPIDKPPYYAVEIHSSSLGTKGGPQTDVNGAVLDADGVPIAGLFAAGNAMAGATGMVYGGAGGTIGPALVFGYRAGRQAAANG